MMAVMMLLLFQACGIICAYAALPKEGAAFRILAGSVIGNLLMMWLPALSAFFLDFTIAAHIVAMFLVVALASAVWRLKRPVFKAPLRFDGWQAFLTCVIPLTAFAVYLLIHHTLRPVDGAIYTGQSGYGDMSMHLGFITSLAEQGSFPPEYSISPGVKLGYPFLGDSISASLFLLGAPLRLSYILPMALAMMHVFAGYFMLMQRWLGKTRVAVLAFFLFFLGGGFGFAYFMDGLREESWNFVRIFQAFYQTPTNYLEENVRWVNPLADLMLPQRSLLFGWAVLIPCLYLLHGMAFERKKNALLLGLLGGTLPMVHTHSFLALVILSATLALYVLHESLTREQLRADFNQWGIYALIALVLSLPQLLYWTFGQSAGSGFVRPHFNWGNLDDNIIWFYIKNIGIVFLLILPAALSGKKRRCFWLCSLPIWIVAEFIVFQPNEYDNNKLLYVVYMLSCGMVSAFLHDVNARLRGLGGRSILVGIVLFFSFFSGILTLSREAVSDLMLFDADHVRAARFIDENLPPNAVFLTEDRHNNVVTALAGRNIVQGSSAYLFFHGVDSQKTRRDVAHMLSEPGKIQELGGQYNISYVYLSEYERGWGASEEVFEDLPLVYQHGKISIYRVVRE